MFEFIGLVLFASVVGYLIASLEVLIIFFLVILVGWLTIRQLTKERDDLIDEAVMIRSVARSYGWNLHDEDMRDGFIRDLDEDSLDEEDRKILLNSGNPLLIRMASTDARVAYYAKLEFAAVYLNMDPSEMKNVR